MSKGKTTTADPSAKPNPEAQGLADSIFATRGRKCMDLVDELRRIGVSAILDIPTIAVVGNQSAGKSSLLEAIAEVPFPRASGTCTKCPTELQLVHRVADWEARVQLRFKYNSSGVLLTKSKDVSFGASIHNKAHLGDLLRKAQLAILNPDTAPEVFLGLDCKVLDSGRYSDDQLGFSSNVIILQIWGAVPNLTLIDLPGVISIAPDGEPASCVDQIKNLAISYIENDKCLILTVLSMDSDPENNTAHALVQGADPDGKRTIGVLTKPDRVQDGDEDGWMALIRNQKQPLKHRWYVVRNPATADIQKGMSWRTARQQESTFFAAHKTFRTLTGDAKKQLGSANLTTRLSDLLSELIRTSLPGIRDVIRKCSEETKRKMAGLPEAPSGDPYLEVNQLIADFVKVVCDSIDGRLGPEDDVSFVQELNSFFEGFKTSIRCTIPVLRPFSTEDRDNEKCWTALPFLGRDAQLMDFSEDDPPAGVLDLDLDQLSLLIKRSRTRELPDNVPYSVKAKLMRQSMKCWPSFIDECCDDVVETLRKRLAGLAARDFSKHACGGLDEAVQAAIQSLIEERQDQCRHQLRSLGDWDEPEPYTQNDGTLAQYKQDLLGHYRGIRNDARRGPLPKTIAIGASNYTAQDALKMMAAALSQSGYDKVSVSDFDKLLQPDEYTSAIEVMAEVRAYFVIAQMRVVDNVPRTIDREFVRPIGQEMGNRLRKDLGLAGPDAESRAMAFLAEPLDVTADRQRLTEKLKMLADARATLTTFSA